ncbi:hypothetical protein IVB45_05245 [Bradyrhizobium sp. 4]|uniref:hypothetical protein n=1 Tax=unclassified Bradyrhizobium TaxID=2631580 RepID=UPI001FF8E33C|nr:MULTISPECIES: hypothetical protein [unclassified Bradyrhizobium]MCK1396991.1 hypothetical protein [Bradyrhizobium sp. 39]MCK1520118.1 hypothetical protein [Bradyrhizobium sp. 17]MCK1632625.1 hypothetical protein [Bradyrhizobium sp. 162]MCK1752267.1 hypothetical protein [Bradyrhizobium sp. 135]UPJ39006.1 hypothetical protein IVB45_05245 [Bradyrhizobium sp. 4]
MQEPKMIASWIAPKATKDAKSHIAGRGATALQPICKGEVVAVRSGHIMKCSNVAP